MKRRIWIYPGALLVVLLMAASGCMNSSQSVRKYERVEKNRIKEEQKALEAARKNHLENQSEAARKMMKDSKKRAKKLNKPKKK
jgi:hypothetical protein